MARRKPYPAIEPGAIFGLLAILALLWLTGQFLEHSPRGSGMAASAVILGAFAAGAICPVAARHLYRAVSVARAPDAGTASAASSHVPASSEPARPAAAETAAEPIVALPHPPPSALMDDTAGGGRLPLHNVYPGISPGAFASFCARQLLRSGWDAQVAAQRPGCQTDVVAEREGCRVALQCAADAHAVGYRAVQQAAAARADENAAIAAVVSGSGYTAAAQHFAAVNHVLLLHYRDLSALDRILAHSEQRLAETA